MHAVVYWGLRARRLQNGNMHEASRQFNVGLMGPQAVICLEALSVRKDVDIHKQALTASSADKF